MDLSRMRTSEETTMPESLEYIVEATGDPQEVTDQHGLPVAIGGTGALSGQVQGNVAHDAADTGNPVGLGANAQDPDNLPAASTAGKRRRLVSDLFGRLIAYIGTRWDPTNDSMSLGMSSASVGGMLILRSLAVTNAAFAVKASPGRVGLIDIKNRHTADIYVHLYDLAVGSVTPTSTTPKQSFYVPASGARDAILTAPVEQLIAITILVTTEPNPEAGAATAPATLPLVNIGYR